jgi:hypothetical protein
MDEFGPWRSLASALAWGAAFGSDSFPKDFKLLTQEKASEKTSGKYAN